MAGTNDTYRVPVGNTAYIGRRLVPSWAENLQIGQWTTVPVTASLATLNPNNNPSINPIYPTSRWVNHAAIVTAWSGACYDRINDVLHLPIQGGHGDYSGNESYKIELLNETPSWAMLRPPSGAIGYGGSELNLNDGLESTGVYADGRPRAGHSYNHNLWIPGRGICVSMVAEVYASASGTRRRFLDLNTTTGEFSLVLDWQGAAAGTGHGFAVWDSTRNRVFACGVASTRPFALDLATPTYTALGSSGNILASFARGAYCTSLDVVVSISNVSAGAYRSQNGFTVFDPQTGTDYQPTLTGSWPSGFTFNGQAGMEWDNVNNRLILWNNASNTSQLATLTPPSSNPTTQPWVRGSINIPAENSVTPSAATDTGTYGRLALAPNLRGAFLLNSTSGPLYFVRTH